MRVVPQIVPFLVTVEVPDLGHVFPSLAVSASGRGGASIFLNLVPLLIQTSILFLLSPNLLVGGLTASGGQGVGRLQCRRRRGFFDKVIARVLGRRGL